MGQLGAGRHRQRPDSSALSPVAEAGGRGRSPKGSAAGALGRLCGGPGSVVPLFVNVEGEGDRAAWA